MKLYVQRKEHDHLDRLAKNAGVLGVFQEDRDDHVDHLAENTRFLERIGARKANMIMIALQFRGQRPEVRVRRDAKALRVLSALQKTRGILMFLKTNGLRVLSALGDEVGSLSLVVSCQQGVFRLLRSLRKTREILVVLKLT